MATVWITKWALSRGVIPVEVDDARELAQGSYITQRSLTNEADKTRFGYICGVRVGKDAFLTEEEAVANFRERIERRLKALGREKAKLEDWRKSLR